MISEFYENCEIFITGGSGVVGQALIEKLLRSCNVRKIYCLVRPKKNVAFEQRLENMKEATIFRQLKIQKPHELDNKLVAIPGDAELPLLGITPDYAIMLENVSIVFHCAATVRFDEPLKMAVKLNVGGTLEALKFAETLENLKVFMHVSTFFSNPYLKRVEPKIYQSPMDWKFCLNLVQRNDISENELDIITKKLIVGFPNTYCFTKNLAESLVNDYKDKLPVAIYRPSIVLFGLEEPEPGFLSSLKGAMGLFAVTGAGLMKTIYIGKDTRLDLTPQDVGINTLMYYAAKTAKLYENCNRPVDIPVYLMSTATHIDLTFPQYIDIVQDFGLWKEAACMKNFLIPGLQYTDNRILYIFLVFVKQLLPSLLADLLLILFGRKPVLMALQRRLFHTLEVMKPFTFNIYESPGITDLEEMRDICKGTDFNLDVVTTLRNFYSNIGYCQSMVYSVREHLLKEDPKTLPKARKILKIKIWLYKLLKIFVYYKLYQKFMEYTGDFYHQLQSDNFNFRVNLSDYY